MEDKIGLKKNSLFKNQTGTKQDKPELFAKKIKQICKSRKSKILWLLPELKVLLLAKV